MKLLFLLSALVSLTAQGQLLNLPTANRALFDKGGGEKFFVGTTGKPWQSGTFGCVRSNGHQMHEGLDIRCVQRDRKGEPIDPVMSTADGTVAYINRKPQLSNYGNYIILRHRIDGIEIFSVYAHLSEIRSDLKIGLPVRAGEKIAVMGRTSNTQERISKERAHVHFELDLVLTDNFSGWHKKNNPKQRNDHGEWNGQNLFGLDPQAILKAQQAQGERFSLTRFIQGQTELCRVFVRQTNFAWLKRYPQLVLPTSSVNGEKIAGYEVSFNFNGVPFRLVPRSATEVPGKGKFQLLAVNAAEAKANSCRHFVAKRGKYWELTTAGQNLLELMVF
jgi:murein DD-endopeptidase MepM/ murein hydrolase activator NlpD